MNVIVAGLGRCGTSLVMQMYAAAGVDCVGEYPSFEDERIIHDPRSLFADLARADRRALKLLDPHRLRERPIHRLEDTVAVWLDRDHIEQAKSQVKLVSILSDLTFKPSAVSVLASSLRKETKAAFRALQRLTTRAPLRLTFESVIGEPVDAATILDGLVGGGLDVEAMARVVRPRSAACAPGLQIEADLVEGL